MGFIKNSQRKISVMALQGSRVGFMGIGRNKEQRITNLTAAVHTFANAPKG